MQQCIIMDTMEAKSARLTSENEALTAAFNEAQAFLGMAVAEFTGMSDLVEDRYCQSSRAYSSVTGAFQKRAKQDALERDTLERKICILDEQVQVLKESKKEATSALSLMETRLKGQLSEERRRVELLKMQVSKSNSYQKEAIRLRVLLESASKHGEHNNDPSATPVPYLRALWQISSHTNYIEEMLQASPLVVSQVFNQLSQYVPPTPQTTAEIDQLVRNELPCLLGIIVNISACTRGRHSIYALSDAQGNQDFGIFSLLNLFDALKGRVDINQQQELIISILNNLTMDKAGVDAMARQHTCAQLLSVLSYDQNHKVWEYGAYVIHNLLSFIDDEQKQSLSAPLHDLITKFETNVHLRNFVLLLYEDWIRYFDRHTRTH